MRRLQIRSRCHVRLMEERDRQKLVELNKLKSQQIGRPHNLPALDNEKVKLTFMFELDGKPLGAMIVREVHELTLVGTDPRLMLAVEEFLPRLKAIGINHEIDELIGFVPKVLFEDAEAAGRETSGLAECLERMKMRRIDDIFAIFEGECHGPR